MTETTASRPSIEAQLRTIIDTAVDGMVIIDATGRIELFNPACQRMFGYDAAEVIGRNVKMLMPEPYHGQHDGYLANYRRTGDAKIIGIGREVVGRRKDGSTFPMDLSVGETREGELSLFVGVIRDISDRLRTEEQLRQAQKMEAVGQLTGGIAHDFNNLLAVISGNLELMTLKQDLGDDTRLLAEAAIRATERGADLTRRLLAFARRQALKPAAVDVNEIIRGMGDLLRRSLSEMIAIHLRLAPDLWPTVIDRGQMENALLNLALNARDAMPGGGELLVVTRNLTLKEDMRDGIWRLPAGDYVEIAVGDNGTGMTANMIAHAFEPFFTTKETGRGTGLGLSMVYGFVTQSGGQVKIYSEVGRGTTVKLYFTRDRGDAGDAAVREMAVAMVGSLGYRVHAVGDGHAALEALDRMADIAILLTDVVLPRGLRGPDIVRQARLLRPDIAVVYMSGFAPELLSGDIAPEADAILIDKPFHRTSLSQALRTALERRGD
jgi:PAS domain S-box-containing protein